MAVYRPKFRIANRFESSIPAGFKRRSRLAVTRAAPASLRANNPPPLVTRIKSPGLRSAPTELQHRNPQHQRLL